MAHTDFDYLYKVVTVGKSAVGKSSLISRFCRNEFNLCSKSTIGVEFSTRTVDLQDGRVAKLELWDTAGQEQFRAITSHFYRNARAALVVYDICDYPSFDDVQHWVDEVRQFAPAGIPIILVGNKLDRVLCRAVPGEEGMLRAAEIDAFSFIETSALDSSNVVKAFESVAHEIHKADLPGIQADLALGNKAGVTLSPGDPEFDLAANKHPSNTFRCCS